MVICCALLAPSPPGETPASRRRVTRALSPPPSPPPPSSRETLGRRGLFYNIILIITDGVRAARAFDHWSVDRLTTGPSIV